MYNTQSIYITYKYINTIVNLLLYIHVCYIEGSRSIPDEMVEVSSSIVDVKSDHVRSESSDSFICISEDLQPSERSHTSPDRNGGGDWEYLKMAEVGEGRGSHEGDSGEEVANPAKSDREGVGGGWEEGGEEKSATGEMREGEEREGGETETKTGDKEDSDWESWDD